MGKYDSRMHQMPCQSLSPQTGMIFFRTRNARRNAWYQCKKKFHWAQFSLLWFQRPLESPQTFFDQSKPQHLQQNCEMCRQLGFSCLWMMSQEQKKKKNRISWINFERNSEISNHSNGSNKIWLLFYEKCDHLVLNETYDK